MKKRADPLASAAFCSALRGMSDEELRTVVSRIQNRRRLLALFLSASVPLRRRLFVCFSASDQSWTARQLSGKDVRDLVVGDPPFLAPIAALDEPWRIDAWTNHDSIRHDSLRGALAEELRSRARQWFEWIVQVPESRSRQLLTQMRADLVRTAFPRIAVSDEELGRLLRGSLGPLEPAALPEDELLRKILSLLDALPGERERVLFILLGRDSFIARMQGWLNRPVTGRAAERLARAALPEPAPE